MYFNKIKTYFGQSIHNQLVDEFLPNSNLYLDKLVLNEWHIYGSSRLGIYKANVLMTSKTVTINTGGNSAQGQTSDNSTFLTDNPILDYNNFSQTRGAKNYELSNHLGNVLVVVSDKKIQVCATAVVLSYTADVVTANDYSPFGAPIAGRSYTAPNTSYRYGFNGQEKVGEIAGKGNINTAIFWEYDTRLGRRWNQDPKPNPSISNYATFGNNPIWFNDPLGDIFGIGKDKQSQDDVKSLAKGRNQKFIKFGEDGKVSLDFGKLSKEKIEKRLSKDEGLSLIKN